MDGQQAHGWGLVRFRSDRRHIAEHADKLIFRNIARQWKRIQPGSAHCSATYFTSLALARMTFQ